jgi:hypothetical protein
MDSKNHTVTDSEIGILGFYCVREKGASESSTESSAVDWPGDSIRGTPHGYTVPGSPTHVGVVTERNKKSRNKETASLKNH